MAMMLQQRQTTLALSPARRVILTAIQHEPGLPVSHLKNCLGTGWGTLNHHLRILTESGHISRIKHGRRVLAYPEDDAGTHVASDALLSGKTARRIAEAIHDKTAQTIPELERVTGASSRVIHHHVRRLLDLGLITSASATRRVRLAPTQLLRGTIARRRGASASPALPATHCPANARAERHMRIPDPFRSAVDRAELDSLARCHSQQSAVAPVHSGGFR